GCLGSQYISQNPAPKRQKNAETNGRFLHFASARPGKEQTLQPFRADRNDGAKRATALCERSGFRRSDWLVRVLGAAACRIVVKRTELIAQTQTGTRRRLGPKPSQDHPLVLRGCTTTVTVKDVTPDTQSKGTDGQAYVPLARMVQQQLRVLATPICLRVVSLGDVPRSGER
ncbi:unnamed protein product, partial [Ixodes persulcatus]